MKKSTRSALLVIVFFASQAFATISYVQSAAKWTCSGSGVNVPVICYVDLTTQPTSNKNLLAVWTLWRTTFPYSASVQDSKLNGVDGYFQSAVGPTLQSATSTPTSAQIFYAANIEGSGIGQYDRITVTFTCPTANSICNNSSNPPSISSAGVVGVEYSGADTVAPLDSVSEAISNSAGTLMDSGTAAPANASLLMFGGGFTDASAVYPGTNFALVQGNNSSSGSAIAEQYIPTSANNVLQRATACLSNLSPCPTTPTGNWLMQMAVFRAATWTAADGVNSGHFHGVLYADNLPGGDIGAQLNNCIAEFSATSPGICAISTGTYALTTTVVKPQWVTIDGQNSVITVASLNAPAIIAATPLGSGISPGWSGSYARRGIRNLTLMGNGPTNTPYGLWLGGDANNSFISSSAFSYGEVFDNLHVKGFGNLIELGQDVGQPLFVGGTLDACALNSMGACYTGTINGVTWQGAPYGAVENVQFVGTIFLGVGGAAGYAINAPDAQGSDLYLRGVSIDFWGYGNSTPAEILWNDGELDMDGHYQTYSGRIVENNGSSSGFTSIKVETGTLFALQGTGSAHTTTALIEVTGSSPTYVTVDHGLTIGLGPHESVTYLVNNLATGGFVDIGPYTATQGGSNYNITATGGQPFSSTVLGINCGSLATTCANTAEPFYRCVYGTVQLSFGSASVASISPAFSSNTSYVVMAIDESGQFVVSALPASGSKINFAGNSNDVIAYQACGT